MFEKKVKSIDEIKSISENLKQQGKKIVHCHGVFDIIHYGHVRHFIDAKKQGDILIVTLTPDQLIQKGPGRPFFNENIRVNHLASIECIDYVALNKWPTAVETIKIIKPDIYAKGKEVLENKNVDQIKNQNFTKSNLQIEKEVVESVGGKLYLTDEITFSSSRIINQITSSVSEEARIFLNKIKQKFDKEKIFKTLDSLKNIKVLVIGDSILDEYIYCESMERSGKEPLICYKFLDKEIHPGGVFAIANHLSGFLDNLTLVTSCGKNNLNLINNSLNKNIEKNIFFQDKETIIKTRYIESYKRTKNFEIYNYNEFHLDRDNEEKIIEFLDENLDRFDMIIISDFGHGMMSPKLIDYFCNSRKFLAINCQFNGGNLGFNFITKYRRADFVSLNERELRLPMQERATDIKIPLVKLSNCLNLNKINLTRGKFGNTYYIRGDFFKAPSFNKNPIDTIGSGDAVYALNSLLAYKDIDPELICFLNNSLGALAVKIIGNRNPVNPGEFKKFISYILK